jgi:hypothetical protein
VEAWEQETLPSITKTNIRAGNKELKKAKAICKKIIKTRTIGNEHG